LTISNCIRNLEDAMVLVRSIGAVAGGYVIFMISAVVPFQAANATRGFGPGAGFAAFSIVLRRRIRDPRRMGCGEAGPKSPLFHAGIVASLLALVSCVSMVARFTSSPSGPRSCCSRRPRCSEDMWPRAKSHRGIG
jgi:hypothetical protein